MVAKLAFKIVSSNCSFARGSDLCLHIIWVLMNVVHVNEHDKLLHQKAHSAENVVKVLSNCQSNSFPAQAASSGIPCQEMRHIRDVLAQQTGSACGLK